MSKIIIILSIFLIPSQLRSQIFPVERSKLHYRLIGFSFPPERKALTYTLEIAAGHYNTQDSFVKNKIQSTDTRSNKIIAEVPSFGQEYTWRVVYADKKKEIKISDLYHFSTQMNPMVDTSKFRLRILQPAMKYKDAYVVVDGGGVLYDMKGNPVWYIPDTNGYSGGLADFKFTPWGTITFICNSAFEINYNGDVLWKSPKNPAITKDTAHGELFHHEFTKLANGHYMVLGMRLVWCKQVTANDSNYIIVSTDKNSRKDGYKDGRFGDLIEYDEKGNVVWSWLSENYLLNSDFNYYKAIDSNRRFDPHDNAFYFDEKNKVIYLGFRFLSRIIKIEYPSGKVIRSYGEDFKPGDAPGIGSGLFCNQHNINFTQDGYLYLFNNNSCRYTDSLPTVVMLKEPVSPGDTFKKVWEYQCTMEGNYPKFFGSGGNAIELPDSSFFVNMGTEYSKLFIVNREKKVLWSALPEKLIYTEGRWKPIHEYRANIISRKDLETLIWSAEK